MTPEKEIGLYEAIERDKAAGKEGMTLAKILLAKHVLDTHDVPLEDRYMTDENGIVQGPFDALPMADDEEDDE